MPRIEFYDGNEAIYIAVNPDGIWGKTEELEETVTLDYDAQGRVIGIELIGTRAYECNNAIVDALKKIPGLSDRIKLEAKG